MSRITRWIRGILLLGIATGGTGTLVCNVIGGAAGGWAGGSFGENVGEKVGEYLYSEMTQ